MSRYKTFDATGLATAGRIYAGDLNAIQDMKADQANFAQTIDLSTVRIGDSSLVLVKYGAGVVSLSAALRLSGLLRVPQGIDPGGGMTTAARDALGAGLAPEGFAFYNSDEKTWQFNAGTDGVRNFRTFGQKVTVDAIGSGSPSSPQDGDIWVAVASSGVRWQFQYNGGSASAYKWEFMGGSALYVSVDNQESTSTVSFTDLTTVGPAIALPRDGDYDVEIGYAGTGGNTGAQANMSYAIGATAASAVDEVSVGTATGGSIYSVARTKRKSGLTAVTLTAKYNSPSGSVAFFANRYMRVTPVRVS